MKRIIARIKQIFIDSYEADLPIKNLDTSLELISRISNQFEPLVSPHTKYLVKSGTGYAMEDSEQPLMTSDYVEAKRFDIYKEAEALQAKLLNKGMDAEIIKLRIGKYAGNILRLSCCGNKNKGDIMDKPKRSDEKYWTGTNNFDEIQYADDLEEYISELEYKLSSQLEPLVSQPNG